MPASRPRMTRTGLRWKCSRKEASMSEPLQAWHEFYFLLGTSAAALTGLMAVVVSINPDTIADRPAAGVRAFITPTMVFFTTAFAVSALLLVPHLSVRSLPVLLALTGI